MSASIFHKGLLIVVIPLVFEIFLVVFLFVLVSDAQEREMQRSVQVSELTAGGLANAAALDALLSTTMAERDEGAAEQFRRSKELYAREIETLDKYQKTHRNAVRGLKFIVDNGREALALLDHLDAKITSKSYTFADRLELARKGMGISHKFREQIQQLRTNHIRQTEETAEAQEHFRFVLTAYLIGGVGLSVLLAIAMGFFFSKSIVQRLAVVQNNTLLLSREEPLPQQVAGKDELSELDRVLHEVADVVANARRRERAVVSNAYDIICTIDKVGIFTSMNPACTRLLGYQPEELVGKPVATILAPDDTMQLTKTADSFEKRAMSKSGQFHDLLCSIRWSDVEDAWFCVMHDITERKQAERFAQQVRNMISHDIRAPLSAIIGSLQLVSSGRVAPVSDEVVEVLSTAEDSAQRLVTLSNDLLQLEKLSSGKLQLNIEPISLHSFLGESVKSVSRLAEQSGVKLVVEPSALTVRADKLRLRLSQVMINLLSNAIKFSPRDGEVLVTCSATSDSVCIAVRDHGRGIPAESLSKLFSPYEQVFATDETNLDGTGLGLAICRELVEAHGGTIGAESEYGKGSTFFVLLPNRDSADERSTQVTRT